MIKKSKKRKKNIFQQRKIINKNMPVNAVVHTYRKNNPVVCETDSKGYPTPRNRHPTEIVLDASEGFIPLWKPNVNLRWRFSPSLYHFFQYPEEAMDYIRNLFGKGIQEWGHAAPINFTERNDAWDFEITVRQDRCTPYGCTLASAFFPDGGRHELALYEKLFEQSKKEQIETMAHELGHIFGLRHFFAENLEAGFPSEKFGEHNPFTIMNYGEDSTMTDNDRNDLEKLYQLVWSGELTRINGTPIKTFYPYHYGLCV